MAKEKSGKKENRRSRSKYPALDKGLNLKSRKDYIEPEYIDGVKNNHGETVIRPLTEDEKAWLNQFYEETVITNFLHDKQLRDLNTVKKRIIEDETVQTLKAELKKLKENKTENKKRIRQLSEIIKITKKQNEEMYAEDLEFIEEELKDRREDVLLYPDKEDHKRFYNENNSRNMCIYTKAKAMNRMLTLDIKDYDEYIGQKLDGLDVESAFLQYVESLDDSDDS